MKKRSTPDYTFKNIPSAGRAAVTLQLIFAVCLIFLLPIFVGSIRFAMNDVAAEAGGGYHLIRNETSFIEAAAPCILPVLLDTALIVLSVTTYAVLQRGTSAGTAAALYGAAAAVTTALIIWIALLWRDTGGTVGNPFRLAEFIPFRYQWTPQNDFGSFLRSLIGGSFRNDWARLYAYKYIPMAGMLITSVTSAVTCLSAVRHRSGKQ